jgi:hypothetical protein
VLRRKRIVLSVVVMAAILVPAFVYWQVYTPGEVAWEAATVGGLAVDVAEGLVLQQQVGDEVWATQGYSIYRSRAGGPFVRVTTLACEGLEPAVAYLRIARQWTRRFDLTDVVPIGPDLLVAFAGGHVYRVDLKAGTSRSVHTLRHYGRGIGRGVMPHGIACDEKGAIYYGEYFRNDEGGSVRLYRSDDGGLSWGVAHEFLPGQIRHIHAVQWDPCAKRLWLAAGDNGQECRIGYSTDQGATFAWIAQGGQQYRACGMLFTPEAVLWATDTGENHLFRWSRTDGRIEQLGDLPSPCYYAQTLDGQSGMLGLAEVTATAWLVEPSAPLRKVTEFGCPDRWQAYGAPPQVRLARGGAPDGRWVYLNPVRTVEYETAVLRIERGALFPSRLPEARAGRSR